jgi:hypothetical protein
MIRSHTDGYTQAEEAILSENHGYFELFEGELGQSATELSLSSPLITAKTTYEENQPSAWGYAVGVVRATPVDVMSYSWIHNIHLDDADVVEKTCISEDSAHSKLVYLKRKTPPPFQTRDFLGRCIWKETSPGTFIFVTSPEESPLREITSSVTRGRYPSAMKMTVQDATSTKLELVCQLDFGGNVPKFLSNRYVGMCLEKVTEVQQYFQGIRSIDEFDEQDGEAIGELLITKRGTENAAGDGVDEAFRAVEGLREIGLRHPFFQPMLAHLLQFTEESDVAVASTLSSILPEEGKTLGCGLVAILNLNVACVAVVIDEWVSKSPALEEMDGIYKWFGPMVRVVAARLAEDRWRDKFARRMSVEVDAIGSAFGAVNPEEMMDSSGKTIEDMVVENPVSLQYHTFRTNVDGVVAAAPAVCLMLISKSIGEYVFARGGVWGDRHSIFCSTCVMSIELCFLFARGLSRRTLINCAIRWPATAIFYNLVSWLAFDWRPGNWASILQTLALWMSHNVAFVRGEKAGINRRSRGILRTAVQNLIFVFFLHMSFVLIIFSQVIPTRLLASGDRDPMWTVVFTGVFIPALAAGSRILINVQIKRFAEESSRKDNKGPEDAMMMYNRLVKMVALCIQCSPTVVLYFNTDLRYAIGSAASQLVSEIGCKLWIVWLTKKRFKRYAKLSGKKNVIENKNREEKAMRTLANRWSAEIVAEKGCIICASIIAFMYFGSLVDGEASDLISVGVVFFAFEFITDVIFVHVMDSYRDIPMLSAIPHEDLSSKHNVASMLAMAFAFNAMGACIGMAASVKL